MFMSLFVTLFSKSALVWAVCACSTKALFLRYFPQVDNMESETILWVDQTVFISQGLMSSRGMAEIFMTST